MAYATVDELAAALRIQVTAGNTEALQKCLDAAAYEINDTIDWAPRESVPAAAWMFSTATQAADPGPGNLRMNKNTPAATSALYLDSVDADGTDRGASLVDIRADDRIRLYEPGDSTRWEEFTVSAAAVDHTGWFELPVDGTASSSTALTLTNGKRLTLVGYRMSTLSSQRLALANRVNLLRGVEWWKSNDAAFGVIGFDQIGALQLPRSTFARHAVTLTPLKQQWGVA